LALVLYVRRYRCFHCTSPQIIPTPYASGRRLVCYPYAVCVNSIPVAAIRLYTIFIQAVCVNSIPVAAIRLDTIFIQAVCVNSIPAEAIPVDADTMHYIEHPIICY